ncbi:DUF2778 domain-containing protein, partial [Escherichia coli]|uniref:tlde1 domain-containing protein n=1 Tax=Escherichia coli TaxID=562 RepID=UPI00307979D2
MVSRPLGGIRTMVYDYFSSQISSSDRDVWFALFREDGQVDDITFFESVSRGQFRLHPAGYEGVSNGCITLPGKSHYMLLRDALLSE